MKRLSIVLLLSLIPTLLSAQAVRKAKSEEMVMRKDGPARFYVNDMLYLKQVKDSIIVNATVQKVDAYGAYYRVRIEVGNLKNGDIDLLTNNIEAMSGAGAKREVLKVFSFDKYMSTIRRRRFFLGNAVSYVDNPAMLFYPINKDDISGVVVEARTIFGHSAHGTTDIDRAYADGNTAHYKLRLERNYLRSNTIPTLNAVQGIFMIRRGIEHGDLTVDITIDGAKFRFEWKIDDIPEVKYY